MEILIILLLIVVNGMFAMAEIAVVSSRKTRLRQKADAGSKRARIALKLADDPGNFLSTIQVGITSIGILNGAFGETAIAVRLADFFAGIPWIAPYSKALSVFVMVMGVTYFTVVVGELVPKRIALHRPEAIAILVARPMRLLARLTHPLVRFFSISSDIILRIMGSKYPNDPPISEEEIRVLMKQGADAGIFEKTERDFVENIFKMDDVRIVTIMTPRKDIVYWEIEDSTEANIKKVIESPHDVMPVCEGGLDHTRGMLQAKDLLAERRLSTMEDLKPVLKPILYVPESISPMRPLENFKNAKNSIALVVDEYGSVQGLVTLYDVLEGFVGDIPWLQSASEPDAVRRDDGSWLIDGGYGVEKFKDLFHLSHIPGEEDNAFHTMAGLVMSQVGRVPAAADCFEWNGFKIEVLDMDGNRIDKILVTRLDEQG